MSKAQLPDIEALKAQGVDRFDPIRFRYIEAMTQRAEAQRNAVRTLLANTVQEALADYQAERATALDTSREKDASSVASPGYEPDSVAALRSLTARLNRQCPSGEGAAGQTPSLEEALREQDTLLLTQGRPAGNDAARAGLPTAVAIGELKSSRSFRQLQSRINAEKTAAQALADEAEDAGPLNPQRLVIRSLTAMQELSPQYLNRFVAYIDTLLWLEQSTGQTLPEKNKTATGKPRAKKRKR